MAKTSPKNGAISNMSKRPRKFGLFEQRIFSGAVNETSFVFPRGKVGAARQGQTRNS